MVQLKNVMFVACMFLVVVFLSGLVVAGGKVGDSSMSWNLDIVDLQEVMISYNYSVNKDGSTTFMYVPFSTDSKVTDDSRFRWKFEVYYVGEGREILDPRNEKVLFESGRTKSDLGSLYSFTIPAGVTRFGIKVGVNSTVIDASAAAEATQWANADNICRTSEGNLHVAYEGGLNDLWYANSSDEGLTWDTQEILAGSVLGVGIICRPDDTIEVYFSNGGSDLDGYNSTDYGKTWSSIYTIADTTSAIKFPSGVTDDNGIRHFCAGVSSGSPSYVNSSNYDTETVIGDVADRSCSIEVDSNNVPYVVYIDTDPSDTLKIASPTINTGWNDPIAINDTVDYTNGKYPNLAIRECDGVNHFGVTFSNTVTDIVFCNTTSNNLTHWDCKTIDTSASANPQLAITNECRYEILYSNHATGNSNIERANSSLSGEWDIEQRIDDVGSVNYPSVADSHFPTWNRINSSGGKVHLVYTRFSTSDVYHDNYTMSPFSSTPDVRSPSFFNLSVDPVNNSGYVNGGGYNFSSAWTDNVAVSNVKLWLNTSSYSAVNSVSNTWNITVYDLAAGDYRYYWNGTDTSNNWNVSGNFTYTISKANGTGSVASSGGFSVVYGEGTTLSVSESNLGDSDVTYQLHRNGVEISEGLFNESVGSYSILLNMSGGQNYTSSNSLDVRQLNVTKASPSVHTSLNGSRSNLTILLNEVVDLNGSLVNGKGDIRLYNNGTLINNGSSPLLNTSLFNRTGVYNITTVFPENQNWSSSFETWFVIVNAPASDTATPSFSNLVVSPVNNSVYSLGQFYQFNSTWVDDTAVDTVLFSFDGVNYSTGVSGSVYFYNFTDLAAGTYSYYWWANDTSGNVNSTGELDYVVQKASSSCTVASNTPVTYPGSVQVNGSCVNPEVREDLFRDGVNVSSENGTFVLLGAGTYTYKVNVSGSENYTSASDSVVVTVNKGSLGLSLSFSPSNSIVNGTESNVSGSGCIAGVSCNLFRDGVNVSNPNVDTLNVGSYAYVYNTSGNANYSASSSSGTLTVSLPTINAFKIRDSSSVDVIQLKSDGDVTANGDVNSSRLCLTDDCISAWNEVNISSPAQNPFDQSLNTTDNVTFNRLNVSHSQSLASGDEGDTYIQFFDNNGDGCKFTYLGLGFYDIPIIDCSVLNGAANAMGGYGNFFLVDKVDNDGVNPTFTYLNKSGFTQASFIFNDITKVLTFSNNVGDSFVFDKEVTVQNDVIATGSVNASKLYQNNNVVCDDSGNCDGYLKNGSVGESIDNGSIIRSVNTSWVYNELNKVHDQDLNTTDTVSFKSINTSEINSTLYRVNGFDSFIRIEEREFLGGLGGVAFFNCSSLTQFPGFYEGMCGFTKQSAWIQGKSTDDLTLGFLAHDLQSTFFTLDYDYSDNEVTTTQDQYRIRAGSSSYIFRNGNWSFPGISYANGLLSVGAKTKFTNDVNITGEITLSDIVGDTICIACNATDTGDIGLESTFRVFQVDMKPPTTSSQGGATYFQFRNRQNSILSRLGKVDITSNNTRWDWYSGSKNIGYVVTETGVMVANFSRSDTEKAEEDFHVTLPTRFDHNISVGDTLELQRNFSMHSPNGTRFVCTIDNSGVIACN